MKGWVDIKPILSFAYFSQRGMRMCKMDEKEHETLGTHIIIDCYGVKFGALNDLHYLAQLLTKSIDLTGAKKLDECEFRFEPNGVTLLFLLSESHASLHSYPEKGYMSCDIYTCGVDIETKRGIDFLVRALEPTKINGIIIERGNIDGLVTSPYIRG